VEADSVLRDRLARYRAVAALLAQERDEPTVVADPGTGGALEAGPFGADDRDGADDREGAVDREGADLDAALDRARAAALAATDPTAETGRSDPRFAPAGGHRGRARPGRRPRRWAVQVVGLAAALLAAVGAAALFGSSSDGDDPQFQAAEAPATTTSPSRLQATGDRAVGDAAAGASADQSTGGPAEASEEVLTARSAAATPPAPVAPLPALGSFATVDDLVARLAASPSTTAGGTPTAPVPPSTPGTTVPPGAANASGPTSPAAASVCAPAGGAVLGTATVGGRPVLVTELANPGGRPRLVGFDPDDCSTVFERER
jgi:hypothetical protein